MQDRYDVLVVGGGTAGVAAAVQAGRLGASVLLVEKTGQLGGTITNAGVRAIQTFFAYGERIIAGIGWEWACRALRELGEPEPDGSDFRDSGVTNTLVNLPTFSAVADEMVHEAGVRGLFHTMLASLRPGDGGREVTLCTKKGLRTLRAHTVIDCSGDADAVALAGLEVVRPAELQPGTLVVETAGYDPESLDYTAIQAAFDKAVAAGEAKPSDPGWWDGDVTRFLKWRGGNCMHVVDVDASTSEGRTAAEIEARAAMLRLQRFCRAQPGLENFHISWTASECGIRETVVIAGRYTVTDADYTGGRLFEDAIANAFYPVDIHEPTSIDFQVLPRGVVPTIPYRALLPREGRGIVVAGRTVSSGRRANSGLRVMAPCMAMGQAAGAAAALAARDGIDVGDLSPETLRRTLAEHGAIVPG
ncbi:MAG: FAD-dependent oxidoreductase [Phycisphaerae bacterium]